MDVSKFLSKVIGIYLIIISLAMLLNMHQFINLIIKLINDAPLMFVAGFFTLILGILMVVSHNIWRCNWQVVITILAWIVLLKGASLILYPESIYKLSLLFVQNMDFAYTAASIDLALGLLLCYFGFKCKRT